MAKKIRVKTHALNRWKERVKTPISRSDLEGMFKRHKYETLKIGYSGRLVVRLKDYVFVIFKTDACITVVTVLGRADEVGLEPQEDLSGSMDRFEVTSSALPNTVTTVMQASVLNITNT
jgi:hypothetical protein